MIDRVIKITFNGPEIYPLKMTDQFLSFNGKEIALGEITSLRFGVRPIQFYHFYTGTAFVIELITAHDTLTLTFKSYWGMARNYFGEIFEEIIQALQPSIHRLCDEYYNRLRQGEIVSIGRIQLTTDGLTLYKQFLPWNDVVMQIKKDMLTINSKSNHKLYTNLTYVDTPNVDVLANVINEMQSVAANNK